ncbi:MAG: GTP 3',8-cyclase MoaA [bacterium]|nr:GTP 3',8-cyclase MoaA [bacterium]
MLIDNYNRVINYLRLSVTDFCNLKCVYCQPYKEIARKSHDDVLRHEEIIRLVRLFVKLGINKIRLTGGEPLMKKNIEYIIKEILRNKEIKDFSLTTNGTLLAKKAALLREAGLKRINISLDSLNSTKYQKITKNGKLENVLEGIKEATKAGFDPIKINVVPLRGVSEEEIGDFARFAINNKVQVRFIELMPLGESRNYWEDKFLHIEYIKTELKKKFSLITERTSVKSGPAEYFRIKDTEGIIGFISPISSHFCDKCNRIRITPDGKIRLCLESEEEVDIKEFIRENNDDHEIMNKIIQSVRLKPKKHNFSIGKESGRLMSRIGG